MRGEQHRTRAITKVTMDRDDDANGDGDTGNEDCDEDGDDV